MHFLQYIATRKWVEIIPDDRPPTCKQGQLIAKLYKEFPGMRELLEYEAYAQRLARNLYAPTEEECEQKLSELITKI